VVDPFFTGAQAIGDVSVYPLASGATIIWDANVTGIGHLDYGIASPDEFLVEDLVNGTSHNIQLFGLAPGTTYQFRVSNRHAAHHGRSDTHTVGRRRQRDWLGRGSGQ